MPNGKHNWGSRGSGRGRGETPRRGGEGRGRPHEHVPAIDLRGIQFGDKLDPELFNSIARQAAETIGGPDRYGKNKPTQLRRFYDELNMWTSKVEQSPQRFDEYLPFIRMLNAKAAYAEGRELVDQNFVKLFAHCLAQVQSDASLRHVKLFFEAFLGFYKEVRPRD
jgi:CRISPR-associated protein Csm2